MLKHECAAGGAKPKRPDVGRGFTFKIRSRIDGRELRQHRFRRGFRLAEDVACTDHGVLNVGSCLALEAQRIFEVKRDDRVARELEHEVAERADGNLPGDLLPLSFVAAGLTRVHFGAGSGDEFVDQVVGLDAESLAAADFDVRAREILFRNVIAQLDRTARSERDHLVTEVRVWSA